MTATALDKVHLDRRLQRAASPPQPGRPRQRTFAIEPFGRNSVDATHDDRANVASMLRGSVEALLALLALFGIAAGCNTDYPLAPVFCDDWCRATMRAGCEGDKPDECVSECLSATRPDCLAKKDALRRCYVATPDSGFVCAGNDDELAKAEPRDGVCASEKAELFACEEPVLSVCLSRCADAVESARGREAPEPEQRFACDDLALDCECACYTVYLLGAEADSQFFECVEASATTACFRDPRAPSVRGAGPSCKPLGVFAPCTPP